MVTSRLVAMLGLATEKKILLVQSFMHTQTMDSEFAVLELFREDCSVHQISAYMEDKITTVAQIKVPDDIRKNFKESTEKRYAREIDILVGMEQLGIHPKMLKINGNIALFKSNLSPIPVLGGRRKRIFVTHQRGT